MSAPGRSPVRCVRRRTTVARLGLAVVAAVVLAGCYGNAVPNTDEAAPECAPVKLLLVGDSLMEQSADAIVERLHALGYPVDALSIAHGGSTSLEYAFFMPSTGYDNPRAELEETLATFEPDVVLVNWGINLPWSLTLTGRSEYAPWAIQATMAEARDMVLASGAKLFWTTIPPRNDGEDGWAYYANEWVKQLGVPLVDWRAAVTSEFDTFEIFLKYREDDSVHPVRTEDRLHFTDDGVARVAQWTSAALAPVACGGAPEPDPT
jgi:hypothetical protein